MILDGINIIDKLSKYKSESIIILGHDNVDVDSIISGYLLEKSLRGQGYNASFCIKDKKISQESLDICKEYGFDACIYQREISGNKFILVDHNEREVEGEIIAIIDHHPTSKKYDLELYSTTHPGSTTLYICEGNEKYFSAKDIELATLALMLDTASFHSTKGSKEDEKTVLNYCKQYNLNYDKLFKSGIYLTCLDDLKSVSFNGLKKYKYGDKLVESSYIQIDNGKDNYIKINEIISILKEYVINKNLDMFVFIVHNMVDFKTSIYKITKNNFEEVLYDQYTSRGSTIMPSIEAEIKRGRRV